MKTLETKTIQGRSIERRKRRLKERRKRENIRQSLEALTFIIGGFAFVGWALIGMWFLYFLMGN